MFKLGAKVHLQGVNDFKIDFQITSLRKWSKKCILFPPADHVQSIHFYWNTKHISFMALVFIIIFITFHAFFRLLHRIGTRLFLFYFKNVKFSERNQKFRRKTTTNQMRQWQKRKNAVLVKFYGNWFVIQRF